MSDQSLTDNPVLATRTAPPSEVYIPEPQVELSLGSNSIASIASSSMPSRRTIRLAALFPQDVARFGTFEADSKPLKLLTEFLRLDSTFIARMEQCGYVKISIIINRFGLDTRSIAKAFAIMGPSHILDEQMHTQTMNLVMFARSQILHWNFSKSPSEVKAWKDLKKSARINKSFETWSEEKHTKLEDFLTDPDYISAARKEMKLIRSKIRSWITHDNISLTSYPPDLDINLTPEDSFKTTLSPIFELRKVVTALESNMAKELTAILVPQLAEVHTALKEVRSSVTNDIDLAVHRKLQATIDHRAKDAIKKHLGPLLKDVNPTLPHMTIIRSTATPKMLMPFRP
jgi:hypothetical protein